MKYFGILVMAAFVLTSCYEDPGTETLISDAFVELDAASDPTQRESFSYLRENDAIPKSSGFLVNRVAPSASSDVNVTIGVDPASTAIEGLHYNLTSPNLVIPSGSWSAEVGIEILADNIEAEEELSLILKIVAADIDIASELDSANHLISISCPIPDGSFLGNYRIEIIDAGVFGSGTYGPDGSVVDIMMGAGTFDRVFAADYFEDTRFNRDFEFSLVCEAVKVPYQDHAVGCGGNDVNLSTGPPTTDGTFTSEDDSSFIINVTDNFDSDCGGGPVQASYRFVKQ